eukprot:CAMPEP_0168554430 /NCGR_PEP_ID=MMETSP0413-20121227/7774_1 /TAXON_ID=136452 /ORGANISM="Filamoeba nolandi, Strain NC-AS-23-1" /LENGTH=289 /DNA_ID=CAMNT_0008585167 /DNA_START=113 /DNA_END=982 /DNA_ORIENTATION=+
MDVARRLVQVPAEKIVYSAAARVSALVSEVRKEFESDPASTTLVDNLEKMARDEQICNAFMQNDAFQSSMLLWDREFKLQNSSSTAVIENQNSNSNSTSITNSTQQPFITSNVAFTFPTFSDSSNTNYSTFSDLSAPSFSSTTQDRSPSIHSTSNSTSYEPELSTFHPPRWNTTTRPQRVPISDRIANYMNSFWKIFFREQPTKPVVVGQHATEAIPKSTSVDDLGVPGSPPQELPVMKLAIAGVAILLMATILRFESSLFQMTAEEGMKAAYTLIHSFIKKATSVFSK